MQRYFIDSNLINLKTKTITITGDDHHHIKNVMRMHPGEKVICATNDRHTYLCVIDSISSCTNLSIISESINENELDSFISFAQGIVKKSKCDEVLRRLVELGASEYFNVNMDYSVVKSSDDNKNYLERRKQIVKEASEQSERGKLLNVKETLSFKDFLNYSCDFDIKICAYENSGRDNDKSLISLKDNLVNKKIICLIGPEGGISEKEIKLLKDNGFLCVGLGKRILRTETSPLYLMSVLGFMIDNDKNN